MFVTGLHLSGSSRSGEYQLSGDNKFTVYPSGLLMGGVELGKRFSLRYGFRIVIPADLSIGSSWEDVPGEVLLNDGSYENLILKKMYITMGLTPLIQYVLPLQQERLKPFLSAGGGVHYTVYSEDERIKERSNIRIMDANLEEGRGIAFSGDFGAGCDLLLSKRQAIGLMYTFRYWKPVNYQTKKDLFPSSPITYVETFFTHSVSLQFLIRLF